MDTELFPAGPNTWAVHEKAGETIALIQHEGRTFRIELVDQGSRSSPLHGMTLGLYETKEVAMAAIQAHTRGSCNVFSPGPSRGGGIGENRA
jgi:hypothetical protein